MKPTSQLAARHDLEPPQVDRDARRPAWRVRSRLEALHADGMITLEELDAATAFGDAVNAAVPSLRSPLSGFEGRGGYPTPEPSQNALDAAQIVRKCQAALGPFACWLLLRCAVHDHPWVATAAILRIHRTTARTWTITAMQALADHLARENA